MQGSNEQRPQQSVNRPIRPNRPNTDNSIQQRKNIVRPNTNPNRPRQNINKPTVNTQGGKQVVRQASNPNGGSGITRPNTPITPNRPNMQTRPNRPITPNTPNIDEVNRLNTINNRQDTPNIANKPNKPNIVNRHNMSNRPGTPNRPNTNNQNTANRTIKPIQNNEGPTITNNKNINNNVSTKQNIAVTQNIQNKPIQAARNNKVQQIETKNKQDEIVLGQQSIIDETDNKNDTKLGQLLHSKKVAKERRSRLEQSQNEINKRNNTIQKDYSLINSNKESFVVKQTKKPMKHFLIVPIAVVAILIALLLIIGLSVLNGVRDMNSRNSISTLSSKAIDKEQFVSAMEQNELKIEEKKQDNNLIEYSASNDDTSYEIDYIAFESQEDAEAYFNYIKDSAGAIESSKTSDVTSKNGAESAFISKTYAGYMDMTYIKNTIIIGIAYDSNEQDAVTKIMDDLGY